MKARQSQVGYRGTMRFPDGERRRFIVEEEIEVAERPDKIAVAQRLRYLSGKYEGQRMIRLAYWIKGKKASVLGKWMFGQFAPVLRPDVLESLVNSMLWAGWFELGAVPIEHPGVTRARLGLGRSADPGREEPT